MECIFKTHTIVSPIGETHYIHSVTIANSEDYGEYFQSEISFLTDINDLNVIVDSLNRLVSGDLNEFGFGYEVYLIQCNQNECRCFNVLKEPNTTLSKPESVILTFEVLQLMTDWKNYLVEQNGSQAR